MRGHNTSVSGIAAIAGMPRQRRAWRVIAIGTLVAGTLDICAAIVSWMPRGVPASRVLQGVAGGLLGRDAFDGGAQSASLGLLLHFLIMSVIVTASCVASRKLPRLTEQWIGYGAAYGVAVYLAMTYLVVPLSASPGSGSPSLAAIARGIAIHIVCVGLPIAFTTRRFG